jgi:transposase-like protein
MKTAVHENSIEAYNSDLMHDRTNKERILDYSLKTKRFTTKMVAFELGVVPSTLSRLVRELERDGKLKTELSKHTCMISGNNATYFYNPEYSTQLRLM